MFAAGRAQPPVAPPTRTLDLPGQRLRGRGLSAASDTMSVQAELVYSTRNGTGEPGVGRATALYWVDIPARRLRWTLDGATRHWQAAEMIACVARRGDGWIASVDPGVFAYAPQTDGTLRGHARLPDGRHALPAMRFNDGRCDRQGRFWARHHGAGHGRRAARGPRLPLRAHLTHRGRDSSGFIVPSGLAFSPDGRTMRLSDSHPQVQRIWALDYDSDTGTDEPAPVRRHDHSARPARWLTIDEDGCY